MVSGYSLYKQRSFIIIQNICIFSFAVGIFIFFFFAHNLWLSVISFHLWKVFKSVAGEEHRLQFLAYSTFVWVTTAILPGGYSLISFFGGDDSPFARLFGEKQGNLLGKYTDP